MITRVKAHMTPDNNLHREPQEGSIPINAFEHEGELYHNCIKEICAPAIAAIIDANSGKTSLLIAEMILSSLSEIEMLKRM